MLTRSRLGNRWQWGFALTLGLAVAAGAPAPVGAQVDDEPVDEQVLMDQLEAWVAAGDVDDPADDHVGPYNDEGEPLSDDEASITPSGSGRCESQRLPGFRVVAEAQVDECWDGVGAPYPNPNRRGRCPLRTESRRNHTYAWGMTEEGRHLWWGTGPNPVCTLLNPPIGANGERATLPPLASPLVGGFLCEFTHGDFAARNPQVGGLGDWRPPQIWRMDTCTLEQEEMTPTGNAELNNTVGLRSAGSLDDVVFMAGPAGAQSGTFDAISNGDGISMLAFEESTGRFLGSRRFAEYSNIRQFLVYRGQLYTGATRRFSAGGGGDILKWTGNKRNPFSFVTVGRINNAPANMTIHEGRIFASTWPGTTDTGQVTDLAGVFMSPRIPRVGGLTPVHARGWQKIWEVDEHEPDLANAKSYGLGPIRSWRGALYWGTMHFPAGGLSQHRAVNGETWRGSVGLVSTLFATQRSASLFRGEGFGDLLTPARGRVTALYADPVVPVWNGRRFVLRRTQSGIPRFGLGGFGWWFNSYVWQQGISRGNLFAATFDVSDQLGAVIEAAGALNGRIIPRFLGTLISFAATNPVTSGADMVRFRSDLLPALPVTLNGGNNPAQFGFRTMSSHDTHIWIGTAGGRPLDRNGGFKIMRFQPTRTINVDLPVGDGLLGWIRWLFLLPLNIFR